MFVVRFSNYKLVEFSDPRLFQTHVGRWMQVREAENSYLLGQLPQVVKQAMDTGIMRERLFALQDGDTIVAGAMLLAAGCLCHTWLGLDMVDPLIDGVAGARCALNSVFGPAYLSWQIAKKWAARNGQRFEFDRAERVYQLGHVTYEPPVDGRLEAATEADLPLLGDWMEGFTEEAQYERGKLGSREMLEGLVRDRLLFLWKQPEATAMAAWTSPTAHGAAINCVYTPPGQRGKGYGKAVVAALGKLMLGNGCSYCFILTDTDDARTNSLYQQIGAQTVCELQRCKLLPTTAASFNISNGFAAVVRS